MFDKNQEHAVLQGFQWFQCTAFAANQLCQEYICKRVKVWFISTQHFAQVNLINEFSYIEHFSFSSLLFIFFLIFLISILLFSIFPHFPKHFPFLPSFLASFFPISLQKFPGGKSLAALCPPSPLPRLLRHWLAMHILQENVKVAQKKVFSKYLRLIVVKNLKSIGLDCYTPTIMKKSLEEWF